MAITFDAASSVTNGSGTTVTVSHTCTGSNRALIFWVLDVSDLSRTCTATYNGVSMTQFADISNLVNARLYGFYLLNPASGTNNAVGTMSGGSPAPKGFCQSYAGVKQSGQPDGTDSDMFAAATTHTETITTTADNCWMVSAWGCGAGSVDFTAGTGTTERITDNFLAMAGDSNGPLTPAGSKSMTATTAAGQTTVAAAISLSPAPSGPAGVKTLNGVTLANVSTVNGIATGSVKTINGIA